jgi:TRAP-type C4-dicarboxylate transport system permease small subunit
MKRFYDKLEEYLLVSSLAFTVILVFMQVVMRTVFDFALSWSEELARYIGIWQIWLGASLAVREGKHIRVEIIFGLLKGKAVHVAEIVAQLIWFGFCVFIVINSFGLMEYLIRSKSISPAMQIPLVYAYLSVPIGCAAMGIRLIENIYREIKAVLAKEEVTN